MIEGTDQLGGAPPPRLLDDMCVAMTFLSRLPVPWRNTHATTRAAALRFAPLVGVVIAAVQSLVLAIGVGTECPRTRHGDARGVRRGRGHGRPA